MKIIDCIKHIDFTVSSVRELLPALQYTAPPPQDKTDLIDIKETAEIVGIDIKHLAQIDKIHAKYLADTDKSTIFALYINGYGEKYYIVQA